MANSEPLAPVRLTSADVLAGVALSDAAGWNQTDDDWQLFVEQGEAIGLRTAQNQLVASAATLPFTAANTAGGARRVAWISMVLVTAKWQHRGLATRLLAECVRGLQAEGITPMLDATPAGEPVYRRMGFEPGFEFTRWQRESQPAESEGESRQPAGAIRRASAQDIEVIVTLDSAACGLDRRFLLRALLERKGSNAWLLQEYGGTPAGFVIARAGNRARQIGPLVAQGVSQALALLDAALAQSINRVFLDVPSPWHALVAALIARGFERQRSFVRMTLGGALPDWVKRPDKRQFVLAGPEFG
ncbi:MAG: GNAT family N-acetyltransferase [Rhodoferax sp.]